MSGLDIVMSMFDSPCSVPKKVGAVSPDILRKAVDVGLTSETLDHGLAVPASVSQKHVSMIVYGDQSA